MNAIIKWNQLFSVTLPSGWTHETDNGVITLVNEANGVGSIEISFARRNQSGQPAPDEAVTLAREFIVQHRWNVPDENILTYDLRGSATSEFSTVESDFGNYWRVWHIINPTRLAFITYNCDIRDADVEKHACDLIIRSFQWLNDNSSK